MRQRSVGSLATHEWREHFAHVWRDMNGPSAVAPTAVLWIRPNEKAGLQSPWRGEHVTVLGLGDRRSADQNQILELHLAWHDVTLTGIEPGQGEELLRFVFDRAEILAVLSETPAGGHTDSVA